MDRMPIFILATMTGLFFAFNGFFYFNAPHFVIPLNDLALMTLFELGAIVGVCWLAAAWVLLNRHRASGVWAAAKCGAGQRERHLPGSHTPY